MIITQNDCIYTDSSPSEWSQKFILLRKISFSHAKTFSSFRSNSSAFESRFGMLFHIWLYVFQYITFTCAISACGDAEDFEAQADQLSFDLPLSQLLSETKQC